MKTAADFDYKGWKLDDAVDALVAYDQGARDSGVHDDAMEGAVREHLRAMMAGKKRGDADPPDEFDRWANDYAIGLLSTDGHTVRDVKAFIEWLGAELGIDV